ncbi:MAG: M23 family metallopeptidase [Woeseiaceae bacterium]|nr:M23 family metallopeptidase [Woeseiaceae bacterium]
MKRTRSVYHLGLVTVFSSLATIAADKPAMAACADDWLGVDEVRQGGNIGLRATNLGEFPITFTMRVRTRDLTSDGPRTITETLDAEQSRLVIMLRENGGNRKGRYRIYCDWTIGDKDALHDDEHLYLLPYASGRSYRIIQGYGSRFSHRGLEHYAIDFNMSVGTPVHAARGGVVANVEESHNKGCWDDGCGAYANFIVVLHDDGTTGEYYHLKQNGALVDIGERVVAGQQIGLSGNTGHTTMPHLHFAVYRAAEWGNTQSIPVRFLSSAGVVHNPRRGSRYVAVLNDEAHD